MIDLTSRMIDIVHQLEREGCLGERTKGPAARKGELRFGTHGSLSVIVAGPGMGDWFDHEREEGGGPLELIKIKGGHDQADWLRRKFGIDIEKKPPPRSSRIIPQQQIVATYDYTDEQGALLFQVVRYGPEKRFSQRAPDGKGGWLLTDPDKDGKRHYTRGSARLVPYHLDELTAAKATGNGHPWRVYIVEGEKDAVRLRKDWGVVATTSPGGASKGRSKWLADYNQYFSGSEAIILGDNDAAGRAHALAVARHLVSTAALVRVVTLGGLDDGGDISDWIDDGGTQSDLEDLIDGTPPFKLPSTDDDAATSSFAGIPLNLLTLANWLDRDIPPADYLLGELLSTTSRVLLYGPTGLGKTNIALAVAVALAEGSDFLHWTGRGRPARVLYIDGEMPSRLMKQRLIDAVRRQGGKPETLFILSREDFPDLPPLNTEAGQQYIDNIIELVGGVDFIVFDNIQALLIGDMKDPEQWAGLLPWTRDLTRRKIGQLWVHHTGLDETHGYGDKSREWGLDTVILLEALERPDADIAFNLKFTKARERTPDNRIDFEAAVITLANDEWTSTRGGDKSQHRGRPAKLEEIALRAIDEALAVIGFTPPNHPKIPPDRHVVTRDMWQRYFAQVYIGSDDPNVVKRAFDRQAERLQAGARIAAADGFVWKT